MQYKITCSHPCKVIPCSYEVEAESKEAAREKGEGLICDAEDAEVSEG
jgi:hypothetical protein